MMRMLAVLCFPPVSLLFAFVGFEGVREESQGLDENPGGAMFPTSRPSVRPRGICGGSEGGPGGLVRILAALCSPPVGLLFALVGSAGGPRRVPGAW